MVFSGHGKRSFHAPLLTLPFFYYSWNHFPDFNFGFKIAYTHTYTPIYIYIIYRHMYLCDIYDMYIYICDIYLCVQLSFNTILQPISYQSSLLSLLCVWFFSWEIFIYKIMPSTSRACFTISLPIWLSFLSLSQTIWTLLLVQRKMVMVKKDHFCLGRKAFGL